jgi:ectoine hydroxylase-related dioxygenase (phytanoyl-CoA dioxygenase family)
VVNVMSVDQVGSFEGRADVPDQCVEEFQRDGCTLVRNLCSTEEIAEIRAIITETVAERSREVQPLSARDTYGKAFLQIENLWTSVDAAKRFTLSPRLGEVAARLAGVDAMRLYHDQALFKEPGGGATPWHQDQGYWPFDGWGPMTMWMPLVDLTAEMGGSMTFVRGSCHMNLDDFAISDNSHSDVEAQVRPAERGTTTYGPMDAGDATFHAGWTLHRAEANPTSVMREVMTVIYFPDGMVVTTPENDRQANDLARWLPGCRPGDRAASPLNPIVFTSRPDGRTWV